MIYAFWISMAVVVACIGYAGWNLYKAFGWSLDHEDGQ